MVPPGRKIKNRRKTLVRSFSVKVPGIGHLLEDVDSGGTRIPIRRPGSVAESAELAGMNSRSEDWWPEVYRLSWKRGSGPLPCLPDAHASLPTIYGAERAKGRVVALSPLGCGLRTAPPLSLSICNTNILNRILERRRRHALLTPAVPSASRNLAPPPPSRCLILW